MLFSAGIGPPPVHMDICLQDDLTDWSIGMLLNRINLKRQQQILANNQTNTTNTRTALYFIIINLREYGTSGMKQN
jgi:hypothetical protein